MNNTNKIRKNLNISIQSKKYSMTINDILNKWDDEDKNISTEVCESILLSNEIYKSPTLINIIAIYKLIQQLIDLYDLKDDDVIELILSDIITIKNNNLPKIVESLCKKKYSNENQSINKKEQNEDLNLRKDEFITEKVESKRIISNTDIRDLESDKTLLKEEAIIPIDILLNS